MQILLTEVRDKDAGFIDVIYSYVQILLIKTGHKESRKREINADTVRYDTR